MREQSIDYEKLLISAILEDADAMRVVVGGYAKKGIPPTDPQPDSFADSRHRLLWRCFQDLLSRRQYWHGYEAKVPIKEWLTARDKQGQVSDEYLGELYEYRYAVGQGLTADVWKWAQRVSDNARKRELSEEAKRIATRASDPEVDADQVIGETVQTLVKLQRGRSTGFRPLSAFDSDMEDTLGVWLRGDDPKKVPTGFPSLDAVIGGGLTPGHLTVLGGRPGTLKTAMSWLIARNIADRLVREKEPGLVAFVSLEMLGRDLLDRALCAEAEVDMNEANRHRYVDDAAVAERVESARAYLRSLPVLLDDEHGLSSAQIYHRVMGLQAVDDVKLVIIDYAEEVGDKGDGDEGRVSGIFAAAKGLAKDLGVPVVLLSQLNREVERNTAAKVPELHHLRMGGRAEAVADSVWFCYWPRMYESVPADMFPAWVDRTQIEIPTDEVDKEGRPKLKKRSIADPSKWYLIIAKARYGAEGHVKFYVEPRYLKVMDEKVVVRSRDEDF